MTKPARNTDKPPGRPPRGNTHRITFDVTPPEFAAIETARGRTPRAEWLRDLINKALGRANQP